MNLPNPDWERGERIAKVVEDHLQEISELTTQASG